MANRWDSTILWDSTWTWQGGDLEEFTWEPQYVYTELIGFKTNVIPMDSGKEVRYSKGQPRREFELVFSLLNGTTKDEIQAFFDAREGSFDTFYWDNPNDSTSYEVRFKEDSIQVDNVEYDMYNINITLLEII